MPWNPSCDADYDVLMPLPWPDGPETKWTMNDREMGRYLVPNPMVGPDLQPGRVWEIIRPRYEGLQDAQATQLERDIIQAISDAEAAARAFLVAHDAVEAADLALTLASRTFRDAVGKAARYTSDEFYDGEKFSLPLVVDGRVIMNDERNQSGMYIVRQVRLVGPAE